MDIALSASQVLLGIGVLVAINASLILMWRSIYGAKVDLANPKRDGNNYWRFKHRTKYPEVDAFRQRGLIFRVGLASSLALSVLAISWTSYSEVSEHTSYILNDEPLIEVEPPRTDIPKPLPPPPAPPLIEEVPIEEVIEDQVDMESLDVEDDFLYEEIKPSIVKRDAKIPPPPPEIIDEEIVEIFRVVEEMPRFPGCEDIIGDSEDKRACSDRKLLEYLYKNLSYPVIARENGVEGKVYIQFVIEKDGSVSNAKIVRDVGAGCGQAALKVVEGMNTLPSKWVPGKQRGSLVRVLYTLPVTFKLQ